MSQMLNAVSLPEWYVFSTAVETHQVRSYLFFASTILPAMENGWVPSVWNQCLLAPTKEASHWSGDIMGF